MKINTGLILSLFLLLVAMLPSVLATSPNYQIKQVEVNDLDITAITNLDVERDEDLEIEVTLFGESTANGTVTDDVRIEA